MVSCFVFFALQLYHINGHCARQLWCFGKSCEVWGFRRSYCTLPKSSPTDGQPDNPATRWSGRERDREWERELELPPWQVKNAKNVSSASVVARFGWPARRVGHSKINSSLFRWKAQHTELKAGKIDKAEQASQGRSPRPSRVGVSRSWVAAWFRIYFVYTFPLNFLF